MIINYSLDNGAYAPTKAHETDAGFDLRTPIEFIVKPNDSYAVDTGVHIEIPKNYAIFVKSKSGLMVNRDITTDGLVDCGYTGSIVVKLFNHGTEEQHFNKGDKVSQIVIQQIAEDVVLSEVSLGEFADSERGNNGFGSSGR